MDRERFKQLKQRASQVLSKLNHLQGDGSTIHERNTLYAKITSRLKRLERKGETIFVGRYGINCQTLDELEKRLKKAEDFIRDRQRISRR